MNTKTIKPFLPSLLSFNISPSGKAMIRHITVLINASAKARNRASLCSGVAIAVILSNVKLPLLSVIP